MTLGTPRLAVSEVMYNPPGDPDLEWLEIVNLEPITADLSGIRVRDAIAYTFAEGTRLEPDERLVLAKNAAALIERHPLVRVHDEYDGRLSGGGERITLEAPNNAVIWSAEYDDEDFWPLMPDGLGYSLVLRDPSVPPVNAESWRASDRPDGSPGAADLPPDFDGRVVISEVLANSEAPYEDAIELFNPADEGAVDLSGWYLSDDRSEPQKFRIPDGTVLEPGGFAAFYETDLRNASAGMGFAFGSDGEEVTLYSADVSGQPTGYFRRVRFLASDENISFGRLVTAGGVDLTALMTPTFGIEAPATAEEFRAGGGAANSPPLIGPVVINEILARPRGVSAQFIELLNASGEPVLLGGDEATGTGGWSLIGSLEWAFPPGTVIESGELLVLCGIEPSLFRTLHSVPAGTKVLGSWDGALGTDHGDVTLAKSRAGMTADPTDGPWVRVDRVRYSMAQPWPSAHAIRGESLERLDPSGYGNDPTNWFALNVDGSPGRPNTPPIKIWLPLATKHR